MEKRTYKVVLINGSGEGGRWIVRQTKGSQGYSSCGKYRFYINEDIPDPDFVVVRGKSSKNTLTFNVAPENVILTTSEPYSVLAYPRDYCKQFGMVCSCQENLKHKNVKFTPAIIFWFAGVVFDGKGRPTPVRSYDDFKNEPWPEKKKLISVVSSNKAFTKGHVDRIRFVERLKQYYGDKIDVFGRGYNGFEDKYDVVAPYKYHIAIENSRAKYYWTEKLSDTYLCGSYPIYYGCTNVGDYFPGGSYSEIDIHDFEGAVKYGREIIASVMEAADRLPRPLCLNVNVPRCRAEEIQGIRLSRQTRGFWREDFYARQDPQGRDYFWLTGAFQNAEPDAEDTDEWALAHRYVSVVPVQVDMTDYRMLKSLDGII